MAYAISEHLRNRLNAAGSNSLAAYSNAREEKKKKKNKGGLLGGLGYTLGQLGTGIFGVGEGVYDFVVGGVADLFGAEEFSERLIKDDVTGDWQRSLNEWYNPSKGMQFVGDVASGLGQTVTYVGLNLIPGAGTALSTGAMVAGAGGRGVTAAYQKTGKLGNKEWLYGTGSGLVEMGLEKLTGGVGKITKSITKSAGKEVTQTVAKSAVRSGLLKNAFKTGAGEFVEEAASEFIDPYLQRLTIDKNAETASLGEILRAGAVGFVSGAIGSAGGSGIGNAGSVRTGSKILNENNAKIDVRVKEGRFKVGNRVASTGNVDSVLGNAKNLLSTIDSKEASDFVAGNLVNLKASYDAYNKLSNKEGIRGKMLLGEIAKNIAYTEVSQGVDASKIGILDNAEDIAKYLTNKKGEAVTVEDIKNNKDNILTDLAIADFSAKMIVSPEYASEMVSQGKMGVLKMQSQYEAWKNSLTQEQMAKASADLGVDLSTASYKDFNKAMGVFAQSQAIAQEEANARQMQANALTEQKKQGATPLPQSVSLTEGETQVYRTQNGDFVGVKRTANGYTVAVESADGSTKQITSKAITENQVNTLISEINKNSSTERKSLQEQNKNVASQTTSEGQATTETVSETEGVAKEESKVKQVQAKAKTQALTEKARSIVKDFDALPANTKARIREMLDTAQAFKVSEENLKFISYFMVRRGVSVSFAEMNDNGLYDTANGKRFIQLNGKNSAEAIRSAAIHEFAHDLRDNSEGYDILSKLALKTLSEEDKKGIKDLYEAYYEEKGKELTEDVLNDELTAYALEKSLNDEEFLKKHINQNTEGFYQKAKGLASRLASWFKGKTVKGYQVYKALSNLYDAVLASPKLGIADNGKVRYQLGKSFAEQVDDVLQGKDTTSSHLQVRETTPKLLRDIGLQDKPMLITTTHTKTAVGRNIKQKNIHNLSEETLKKLPSLIEGPAIIMDSNKEGSIVCFVNAVDNDNNPVLCAIKINGKGNYNNIEIETNLIASVYGKDTNPVGFISKAVEEDRLLYWNKKMSQDLFETNGLQLSDNLKQVDSNVIIRKSRYIVNPSSENSSEKIKKVMEMASLGSSVDSNGKKLTEEQRKFFKDSKVRDKDGKLLAVYHNTNNEFTVFDKDKIGTKTGVGMFGKGFYFGNKGTAKGYGKNQIKAYINIKNPYYATESDVGRINTKKLQSEGYDGVIGEGAERIYVAFEPNQIKLTTNQNPTESEDIRYSLTIDGENTPVDVQESKNLVALHNLSEDNLLRVIELGGFPMPSIAVTTTELPHENYGDITVVFGKDTIDPEKDLRNVVYDRDAWTPTTPTVDVKLSNSGVEKIVKDMQSEVESYPAYKRSVYSFFDSKFRDNNGDYIVSENDYTKNAFGDRAIQNSGLIAAYLAEKGISVEPVYSERGFTMGWTSFTRKEAESLLDFVGITKDVTRDNATQKQREEILEKFIEYRAKENLARFRKFSKNANLTVEDVKERLRKDYDDGNVSQLFFMSEDVFNEKRPKDIYDEYATLDKLKESITDKDDFYNWVWTKIKSTFEKKGIDNDSDIFDRYGNRRSFEQRHFAYTAANIVKAMAKGEQEGKTTLGITAGALAAKLSKQFESIDSIREAKKYLALVSEEDLKAFNDKTYQLYDEIVSQIAGQSSDFLRDGSRRDDVGEILGKCAEARPLSIENITKIFEKETKGYNLGYKFNEDIAKQALTLFQSLKHVPTTYFEAKPRRVVGLEEIKTVLIPAKSSENLKTILDESGISWQPYEGEKTRGEIIKSLDDERFSIVDNYTEKQYNDFGWARVNNVLSSRENANFRTKYGEIKRKTHVNVHKTSKGEIIVPVNDMEKGKFGINNVLVFAKGTYENYKITRVIRLNSNNETHLDIVRGFIYEYEKDTNAQSRYTLEELYGEEIIEQYDSRDFDDYRTSKAKAGARGSGTQSVGIEQDSRSNAIGNGTFGEVATTERNSLTYATTGKTQIAMDNELSKEEKAYIKKVTKRGRFQSFRVAFTNAQAGLEDELKYLGIEDYEAVVQSGRTATAKAQQMIGGDIYDITAMHEGKDAEILSIGIDKVMAPIKKANLESEFFDYLFNLHNIDRVAVGKPVNGNTIDESKKIVADYEKAHPEFKDWLKAWDKMTDAVMTLRVKAGLITQERADELKKMYKHYVPTYREGGAKQGMAGARTGKNTVAVSSTLKKATGSTDVLLRPDEVIARQMMEVARAVEINYIANKLYEGYLANGENSANIEIVSVEKMDKNETEDLVDLEAAEKFKPNKNTGTVTFYRDGKRITMKVSKNILTGFDAFHGSRGVWENNFAARALAKAMQWFKTAVTNLNPFFLIRNAVRDIQDAFIYTKNGKNFAFQIPNAWKGILSNSKEWQLYLAAGGINSSIFSDEGFTGKLSKRGFEDIDISTEEGLKKGWAALKKAGLKFEAINQIVEQIPRFTEFLASLENGKTVDQALLDSADVTVNFGRSGVVTKVLNRYLIPFFNASVQGASKIYRTFTARKTFAQWSSLVIRCAILGIVPALLNNMIFDDDEEYQNLRTDLKENYFLFKIGDKFIKIPRGRINAILSGAVIRTDMAIKGEEDAFEGYGENIINTLTPVESASRTIFSPFTDVKTNTTWYGTKIEGREFENKAIKDRYDEGTSSIAVWFGKSKIAQSAGLSPKKIHYLIDQYTGVVGDFILPMTTKSAERSVTLSNFTVDPVTNNKLSSKFYKIYDETTYKKSSGDENAALQIRYYNKVKDSISTLYKQKDEIQKSNLSDKEKLAQTRLIQILINQAYQNAIDESGMISEAFTLSEGLGKNYSVTEVTLKNYKKLEESKESVGRYVITYNGLTTGKLYETGEKAAQGLSDMIADYRYAEGIREVYGTERALKEYNSATYEKAQKLNSAGVSYDDYYFAYMTAKQYAGDSEDKRNYVLASIDSMGLDKTQTLMLIYALGFSVKDGEFYGMTSKAAKTRMARYIKSLKISTEEKISLAKACGLTVKNGKIITK